MQKHATFNMGWYILESCQRRPCGRPNRRHRNRDERNECRVLSEAFDVLFLAITNQGSPYLTMTGFPGDLGVFEKYGNETKEVGHEDCEPP